MATLETQYSWYLESTVPPIMTFEEWKADLGQKLHEAIVAKLGKKN